MAVHYDPPLPQVPNDNETNVDFIRAHSPGEVVQLIAGLTASRGFEDVEAGAFVQAIGEFSVVNPE